MKKSNRANFTLTGFLFLVFILFTTLLMFIDVKQVGPRGSYVGFATINSWFSKTVVVNMTLYNITDWLGLVAILVAFGFAVLGLCQLIKRRSFLKVDSNILVLGGFYLLVIAAYIFFEFNIINYRPVLINNNLEASYPSSTTMLVMCIMPTAIMQFNRLIKARKVRITINTITIAFAGFMVIGRLLSGVHWLTDIVGGAMLSASLVMLYYSVIRIIEYKNLNNS